MKKSLALFSFIVILSFISIGLKAQGDGSIKSYYVGEIRTGETFTMSLERNENVTYYTSLTIWHQGGSTFRLLESDGDSRGKYIPIGEVTTNLRRYRIYGIVKQ